MKYKFQEVFEFIRNGANIKQGIEGGYPITRIETISERVVNKDKMGYAGIYDVTKYEDFLLNEGDILMSHINSEIHLGKTAIYESVENEEKIIHGMNLICLRPKKDILYPKFAFYYFNTINFKLKLNKIIKKSVNQASFSVTDLKKFEIELPKKEVQIKVSNLLDKSRDLINKRKTQIEALDQLTKSVFLKMFGDPVVNSKGYAIKKLSTLCTKITDGTHHSPPSREAGVPYITAKHLRKDGLDFYSNPTYVSEEDHKKIYARCNPVKGDVLYIKDGATTGIAGINKYHFEFSMLSSLALIKTDESILNSYYLVYYLNNKGVFNKVTNNMSGGAIKRLTLKKINDIDITLPPIKLQNKFSEYIRKIEDKKLMLKQGEKFLEDNYNSIIQLAFKGELFTQEKLPSA